MNSLEMYSRTSRKQGLCLSLFGYCSSIPPFLIICLFEFLFLRDFLYVYRKKPFHSHESDTMILSECIFRVLSMHQLLFNTIFSCLVQFRIPRYFYSIFYIHNLHPPIHAISAVNKKTSSLVVFHI